MTNNRQCPSCNYKYSFWEYSFHIFSKINSSKWHCKNCNTEITFNVKRRSILLLITIAWIFFYAWFTTTVNVFSKISSMGEFVIFLPLNLLVLLIIFGFDKFVIFKKEQSK
jgi:hypothetical protein